jgi:hypothetical protein
MTREAWAMKCISRRAFLKKSSILAGGGAFALMGIPLGIHQSKPRILLPVCMDNVWGYIDTTGEMVIPPQFKLAWEFRDGLAVAAPVKSRAKQDHWPLGFIDINGRWVVPPRYEAVSDFHNGFAFCQISKTGKWHVLDRAGNIHKCLQLHNLLFKASGSLKPAYIIKDGERLGGYLNERGETAIEFQFHSVSRFTDNVALVEVEACGGQGLIDKNGDWVLMPKPGRCYYNFLEDLAIFWDDDLYGFVDKTGTTVIEPRYSIAKNFGCGLAVVQTQPGSWLSVIDQNGHTVINEAIGFASLFSEGLLAALDIKTRRWGYLDNAGHWAIKPMFDSTTYFEDGFGRIRVGNIMTYVNRDGELIWWPKGREMTFDPAENAEIYLKVTKG